MESSDFWNLFMVNRIRPRCEPTIVKHSSVELEGSAHYFYVTLNILYWNLKYISVFVWVVGETLILWLQNSSTYNICLGYIIPWDVYHPMWSEVSGVVSGVRYWCTSNWILHTELWIIVSTERQICCFGAIWSLSGLFSRSMLNVSL